MHSRLYAEARERPIDAARRVGLHRLSIELHLTPEQETAVTKELDDYAKYYQNIDEQREDIAEHGRERILSVLNADQKRRFTEIFGPAPGDLMHPFAH